MTDPMHECISQNTNFSLYSAFDIVASLIEAVFDSENFGMHKTLKKTYIVSVVNGSGPKAEKYI